MPNGYPMIGDALTSGLNAYMALKNQQYERGVQQQELDLRRQQFGLSQAEASANGVYGPGATFQYHGSGPSPDANVGQPIAQTPPPQIAGAPQRGNLTPSQSISGQGDFGSSSAYAALRAANGSPPVALAKPQQDTPAATRPSYSNMHADDNTGLPDIPDVTLPTGYRVVGAQTPAGQKQTLAAFDARQAMARTQAELGGAEQRTQEEITGKHQDVATETASAEKRARIEADTMAKRIAFESARLGLTLDTSQAKNLQALAKPFIDKEDQYQTLVKPALDQATTNPYAAGPALLQAFRMSDQGAQIRQGILKLAMVPPGTAPERAEATVQKFLSGTLPPQTIAYIRQLVEADRAANIRQYAKARVGLLAGNPGSERFLGAIDNLTGYTEYQQSQTGGGGNAGGGGNDSAARIQAALQNPNITPTDKRFLQQKLAALSGGS